ncbi:MAG: hypothetical protein RMI04_09160 [Thermofilaceae archaeon]|nr:hypothetical protein [Thermofilaceae archaeon]
MNLLAGGGALPGVSGGLAVERLAFKNGACDPTVPVFGEVKHSLC